MSQAVRNLRGLSRERKDRSVLKAADRPPRLAVVPPRAQIHEVKQAFTEFRQRELEEKRGLVSEIRFAQDPFHGPLSTPDPGTAEEWLRGHRAEVDASESPILVVTPTGIAFEARTNGEVEEFLSGKDESFLSTMLIIRTTPHGG